MPAPSELQWTLGSSSTPKARFPRELRALACPGMTAHSRQYCDRMASFAEIERPTSGLLLCRQHLLGDAVGVDRGRKPAIDRDLAQDGGAFLLSDAVAQGAAEMRLELVHAAEAG